jgi:hypothetical protein
VPTAKAVAKKISKRKVERKVVQRSIVDYLTVSERKGKKIMSRPVLPFEMQEKILSYLGDPIVYAELLGHMTNRLHKKILKKWDDYNYKCDYNKDYFDYAPFNYNPSEDTCFLKRVYMLNKIETPYIIALCAAENPIRFFHTCIPKYVRRHLLASKNHMLNHFMPPWWQAIRHIIDCENDRITREKKMKKIEEKMEQKEINNDTGDDDTDEDEMSEDETITSSDDDDDENDDYDDDNYDNNIKLSHYKRFRPSAFSFVIKSKVPNLLIDSNKIFKFLNTRFARNDYMSEKRFKSFVHFAKINNVVVNNNIDYNVFITIKFDCCNDAIVNLKFDMLNNTNRHNYVIKYK